MPDDTTVRDILFDYAPELETADTAALARIDRFIQMAADDMDAVAYATAEETAEVAEGTWFNRANALLAAHMLTMRKRKGDQPGAITSKRVGDVSVSYAAPSASDDDMVSTPYGKQYLDVRSNVFTGLSIV